MRSAYDQLWAYVCSEQTPFDGTAVVDLPPEHVQQIQDHTLIELDHDLGVNISDYSLGQEMNKIKKADEIVQANNGSGWIEQAKRFGIIRLQTKQEREARYRRYDNQWSKDDADYFKEMTNDSALESYHETVIDSPKDRELLANHEIKSKFFQ